MTRPYDLSAQGRRERSERLEQLRSDPDFATKQAAAANQTLKRLHAHAEFAAKHAAAASENMKRLHTDPEFAANAWLVEDAPFTFRRRDWRRVWRTADEVHAMSLANLDGNTVR
jgi:hypothetical protein